MLTGFLVLLLQQTPDVAAGEGKMVGSSAEAKPAARKTAKVSRLNVLRCQTT